MKKIELRELQLLELEIAREIRRICNKNSISFFIIGGTLLGAVRHNGFIPWDDDLDIGMLRDDYNRFLEIAPRELDSRFFLQTTESDSGYYHVFSKVRLNGTHMYEIANGAQKKHDGIFVDIFPYDRVVEEKALSKLYTLKLKILGKMTLLKHSYDLNALTSNPLSKVFNMLLKYFPISTSKVDRIMDKEMFDDINGKYLMERDGMFKGSLIFPCEYIYDLTELQFENELFPAPKEYDKYLRQAYGDYMKLPPLEDRLIGHSVLSIELERELKSYFRDY